MSRGYIQEIFSSFQGEGSAIEGSCYGLRQIFLRFAGCPLALGIHGTKGCTWCDSPKAKGKHPRNYLVETDAGSQKFEKYDNPVTVNNVIKSVTNLTTNDLHSISLTGGEPLYQPQFAERIISKLKEREYKIYLETAYCEDLKYLERISNMIDFACIDVKDDSSGASLEWEKLILLEINMCRILKKAGVKVFAKTVITKSSKYSDFEKIAELCGEIEVPLAIQIVTPPKNSDIRPPTWEQINDISEIAAKYLAPEKIGLSVQMHKCIDIL
ncbi:MAG: radical SAM protein [Candidatus Heimdallarchaeaceae archaeon]|jgi:organic radical activating enzyme